MKKIILILVIFLLNITTVYAEENLSEVILEDSVSVTESEPAGRTEEKTLREKLSDIYHLEVEQTDKPNFLLKDILTKYYDENSILDRTQLWAGYGSDIGMFLTPNGPITNHFDIITIDTGFDGYLKNDNADFRVMLHYNPLSSKNFVQNLFADNYIATNKIPHHRVMVGNTRPPLGMEGSYSPYVLPFVARSQISRNFATVRKLGARVGGDYSLIHYDVGVYSSDTYFKEFFPGAEFIGKIDLKPLGKTDGKYGKLLMGASMDSGHRDNNFNVIGAHVQYEYKKFMANFECMQANGYNGSAGYSSDKHANGFYTTVGYKITPKIQALLRYDEFNPNTRISNNTKREYSAGVNYFIKGQGFKLMLNYVFCQNDSAKDSHKIILGTQILL